MVEVILKNLFYRKKSITRIFTKKYICYIFLCVITINLYGQHNHNTKRVRATYYHDKFENRKTASGEIFSQKLYTAAHKTIPFHTIVKVTNNRTNESILVKINDRCRHHGILDLTKTASKAIKHNGSEYVSLQILGKDYIDIWKYQNILIADENLTNLQRNIILDSLIYDKQNGLQYNYIINIGKLEDINDTLVIQENIPESYKDSIKYELHIDNKSLNTYIGTFTDFKIVCDIISNVKKKFPLAYIEKREEK